MASENQAESSGFRALRDRVDGIERKAVDRWLRVITIIFASFSLIFFVFGVAFGFFSYFQFEKKYGEATKIVEEMSEKNDALAEQYRKVMRQMNKRYNKFTIQYREIMNRSGLEWLAQIEARLAKLETAQIEERLAKLEAAQTKSDGDSKKK